MFALLTLPCRPFTLWRTGTNRTLNADVVRTSMASGVPEDGKALSASLASATALAGSTSARMDRLGWMSAFGTGTFQDAFRLPSSGERGTESPGAPIMSSEASTPPL